MSPCLVVEDASFGIGGSRGPDSSPDDVPGLSAGNPGAPYPDRIGARGVGPMDGVSLAPLIRGRAIAPRNLRFAYKDFRIVRNERWKLLGQFNTKDPQKAHQGAWRLFDPSTDQSETIDVADKRPEVVKELSAVWENWDSDVGVTAGYHGYWNQKAEKESDED